MPEQPRPFQTITRPIPSGTSAEIAHAVKFGRADASRNLPRPRGDRAAGGTSRSLCGCVRGLLEDKSGSLARLRSAVANGDPGSVQSNAHALKGLAMMCGAVSVGEAAASLEAAGRAGEPGNLQTLLNRLDAEMLAARIVLAPYR